MDTIYMEQQQELETVRIQFKKIPEETGKNHSQSFTIKGMDLDEVFLLTKNYFEKLRTYGKNNIKIICYKEAKQNEQKTIK